MARVSDGCVTLHVSAAFVKLRSLTVARKYLTWCISIAGFYQAVSQLALALRGPGPANSAKASLQRSALAMNVAVKPQNVNIERPLAGKLSLVTGSTSGIGLGIARALAAAGSDIVLNGFGKPDEVAQVKAKIAADFKVRVVCSAADMSNPLAIREMIEAIL